MAETSKTIIEIAENSEIGKIEEQKCLQNGDVHVSEQKLENGGMKTAEKVETTEDKIATEDRIEENPDVAHAQEQETETQTVQINVDDESSKFVEETKDEIEVVTVSVINKESEIEISKETEENGGFEVIQVNEKTETSIENKSSLQEFTIIPLKEETTKPNVTHRRHLRLERWDTRKSVFFFLFLFLFVAWIIGYYAYDTGLIPNDKKK